MGVRRAGQGPRPDRQARREVAGAAKVIYTGMQLVLTGQATPAEAMAKAGAS